MVHIHLVLSSRCLNLVERVMGRTVRLLGAATLYLLLTAGWTSYAADLVQSVGVLTFPSASAGSGHQIVLSSPADLARFSASLVADGDVSGRPVVVDLVLRRSTKEADTRNILEPSGNWHGAQPFIFAASDFRQGPENSIYGRSRVFHIQEIAADVLVEVTEAVVNQNGSATFCCSFERLTMTVTLAPLNSARHSP